MWAILHKETKLYFGGFSDGKAVWDIKPYGFTDRLSAQCQADLFVSLGINAQRKVINLDK